MGKVVKESCRRRRMWKVEDGLRNRFLEVQLCPPIAEASDVRGPGVQINGNKFHGRRVLQYTGLVLV